jgi:pyruvate-formate lyase-activating enzyme
VNVDLGAFALRDAKSFPNMGASNDTMREIAKALRRHFDTATLEKVVNELLDVPGNRDFREAIEELARELLRR